MWKLTIKQTTKKKYDKEIYDHKEEIVYEADNMADLVTILMALKNVDTIGRTEYSIERVVEE